MNVLIDGGTKSLASGCIALNSGGFNSQINDIT